MQVLLNNGVDVMAKSKYGTTAISIAKSELVAKLLRERGRVSFRRSRQPYRSTNLSSFGQSGVSVGEPD